MGWGDNGSSRPTSDEYRNSKYWENVERKKREEAEKKAKLTNTEDYKQ